MCSKFRPSLSHYCRTSSDGSAQTNFGSTPSLVQFPSLPPATKLGQGNIFSSACQEFCSHRGGGSAPLHAGIHPPGADMPHEQTPLQDQRQTLQEQTPPRARPTQEQTSLPPNQTPPWIRHPLDQRQTPPPRTRGRPPPPPSGHILRDTGNKRTVRILLECNLVSMQFLGNVVWTIDWHLPFSVDVPSGKSWIRHWVV